MEDYAFFLFQYAFSAASATIVAGTLAERCQMAAYLCYSLMLAGVVYPVVVHAIWSGHGFLSAFAEDPFLGTGCLDFAGGGVVHTTGGTTALFATMILGPRRGRFHDEQGRKLDKPKEFPGHSIALQVRSKSLQQKESSAATKYLMYTFFLYTFRCWVPLLFGLVGTVSTPVPP